MKNKRIKGMLAMILCCVMVFLFFGCSSADDELMFRVNDGYVQWKYSGGDGWNNLFSVAELNENGELSGESAYDVAVSQGFEGTQEEWLASLVGENGSSVRIGANGNWWIGETDTGVSAMGTADGNLYIVPDFTRKTLSEIQDMPEYSNFMVVYHGEVNDNFVVKQSIPAGVMAAQGAKIELYMNGYSDTSDAEDIASSVDYELTINYITLVRYKNQVAEIEVHGKPNTEYSIEVIYSSGESTSADLIPQISDNTGKVSWRWMIGSSTLPGTYPVIVTDGEKSVSAYITVMGE